MKKPLLITLILTTVFSISIFISCLKDSETNTPQEILIKDFINSPDYKSNSFLRNLNLNFTDAKLFYVESDKSKPVIDIPIFNCGDLIGVLEVIKNNNLNILLPNNGHYFMLYKDFSNFDFNTGTGEIKLNDLNYDNLTFNQINYIKGIYARHDFKGIPDTILKKYNNLIEKNKLYFSQKSKLNNLKSQLLCDENGNGNLSFSECYKCFNNSCASTAQCYTLCYGIGDVAGWVLGSYPVCQASIGASCIYLSSVY